MSNPSDYISKAANAFMLTQVSVSTWDGVKLSKKAKAILEQQSNAKATRTSVYMLGRHHAELKAVQSKYTDIRTYLYANTLHFGNQAEGQQKRGQRLVPTFKVGQVLTRLNELVSTANDARDKFCEEYESYIPFARADLGDLASEITFPSKEEVRAKFSAHVQPPQALSYLPADKLAEMSIPMATAQAISDAQASQLMDAMGKAKEEMLEKATEHLERLNKQLTNGQRFHQSLIDSTEVIVDMLEATAHGDPTHAAQLHAVAKDLRDRVLNTRSVDTWKASPIRRENAAKASSIALATVKQIATNNSTATETPVALSDTSDNTQVGGILADLW